MCEPQPLKWCFGTWLTACGGCKRLVGCNDGVKRRREGAKVGQKEVYTYMYYHFCHEAEKERLGEVMAVQNSGIKKGWNQYGQLTIMGGQEGDTEGERWRGREGEGEKEISFVSF